MSQDGCNVHCRWDGASGYCLFHRQSCPVDNVEESTPSRTNENDFSGCPVYSTEVKRGEPVKAVWCLKNISNQSNLEVLMNTSSCVVEVGEGANKIRLRFYLDSTGTTTVNAAGGCPGSQQHHTTCEKSLSMCCAIVTGGGDRLTFAVKVDRLVEGSLQFQSNLFAERVVAFKSEEDRKGKVIEKLLLPFLTSHFRPNGQIQRETYCLASNKDLCLGITVIPFVSAAEGRAISGVIQTNSASEGDGGLGMDLRKMLADENNFSDVVLETKDGMDVNAHKFILAARSPVMKQIIQEESFGGIIPIDFELNPIRIILQWMYTGRLTSEATGNVLEEVVLAAEKFQLVEMLKQLDKELISACNSGNMFQLFEIAKKNDMHVAMDQITAFIKGNI